MSTSTPDSSSGTTGGAVVLPPGVTVGPGRETSEVGPLGNVVQGMLFPITLPNQTTTTVFVPYTTLQYPDQVQALFTQRIDALTAITG